MSGYAVRKDLLGCRAVDGPGPDKDDPSKIFPDPETETFSLVEPVLPVFIGGPAIDVERDRRIDAGITFDGELYQSKAGDRENISGAAQMAFMAVVAGAQPGDLRWSNPNQDFTWICSANTLVPMDAQTVVEFGRAAAQRKSDLIYAGRALKDMSPIPENYTDDQWWPE